MRTGCTAPVMETKILALLVSLLVGSYEGNVNFLVH